MTKDELMHYGVKGMRWGRRGRRANELVGDRALMDGSFNRHTPGYYNAAMKDHEIRKNKTTKEKRAMNRKAHRRADAVDKIDLTRNAKRKSRRIDNAERKGHISKSDAAILRNEARGKEKYEQLAFDNYQFKMALPPQARSVAMSVVGAVLTAGVVIIASTAD